jgi:short-chain fatty acids transporter
MKLLNGIERIFKSFLPTPFTIAILITLVTFLLAFSLTDSNPDTGSRGMELVGFWYEGLWTPSLLTFAVQMMLMLVLGHALALTKPVNDFMSAMTHFCTNTANSAFVVTLLTILVSLFNWGLGLIFGAILARKVGEKAAANNIKLNYALIGAAGYSGLMVWHGGISGSAPIKASEEGHITSLMEGILTPEQMATLPDSVPMSDTVFGSMNLVVMLLLVICVPLFMFWIGKRSNKTDELPEVKESVEDEVAEGTKVDSSPWFSRSIGVLILTYGVYIAVVSIQGEKNFLQPNYINFVLLGLGLLLHFNIQGFLKAIDQAIRGAAGILIQFPLYFGIMGLMIGSGLISVFSDFFVEISTEVSFPIYSFISAGIVNVFVPSGGGQWGVQGPIIIQSAMELGVSIPKSIMALSYGDQLTNMLQPFWALPLLGITGLKAKSILPYTLLMMVLGAIIYLTALFIF